LAGISTLKSTVSVHISPTVPTEEVFSNIFLGVDKLTHREVKFHIKPVKELPHLYFFNVDVFISIFVLAIK